MADQMNIPLIASIIAFAIFILIFFSVFQLVHQNSKNQKIQEKITGYNDGSLPSSHVWRSKKSEKKSNNKIFSFLDSIGKGLHKEDAGIYSPTRLKFLMAGYRTANAPTIFFGIKFFLSRNRGEKGR